MKIFISWSGTRSKSFATDFTDWIRCVIQGVRPWISTQDIPNGSIWFNEIAEELSDTQRGFICLTKENLCNPWLLFEAGALFKGLPTSRVCTILIGIAPEEVPSPLGQFNHTKTTKDDIWKLVHEINQEMKEQAMKPMTLKSVFEKYWDDFQVFSRKAEEIKIDAVPANDFTEKQMLAEILALVRNQGRANSSMGSSDPVKDDFLAYSRWYDAVEKSGSITLYLDNLRDGFNHVQSQLAKPMSILERQNWESLRGRAMALLFKAEFQAKAEAEFQAKVEQLDQLDQRS